MRRAFKTVMSCFVLLLGASAGFWAIVWAGQVWVPQDRTSPSWAAEWFGYVGVWLFGIGFLVATIAAMSDRRRGGLLFLGFAPVTALCTAYSTSVFEVTGADGNSQFYLPVLWRAVIFWALFFLPFVLMLVLRRRRKLAAYSFLVSAMVASIAFGLSRWTWPLLNGLAVSAAFFGAFGGFWLGTWRLGWTALIAAKPKPMGRRFVTILAGCLAVALLDIVATIGFTIWRSTANGLDCGWRQPFNKPMSSRQTVFTARLVRSGHKLKVSGRWAGEWAIGEVEKRYWGLGARASRFVLLTNNVFWEGENYFIDGNRAVGLLTRYLPIVETGVCTRTRPVVYSAVELRVLRQSGDFRGGRIIGQVTDGRSGGYANVTMPPKVETPVAGALIRLSGPAGTTILTSDQEGIYESDGLPSADYTLRLDLPDTQYARDRTVDKRTLLGKKFNEADFAVVWNGSIEGEVRSSAGGAARVWVQLDNADPGHARINPIFFRQNDASGHFRISPLAPGRYKLAINPNGPSDESSYATVYYPAGNHPEDASALEIGEGEHIKNVILTVSPLQGRKLKVYVTWPDGKPAGDAWTYVAYQNTPEYEELSNATYFARANQNGVAELHIFGDAHVRVFAEEIVNEGKVKVGAPLYSAPIELDPANLPEMVELCVSSKELPEPH
jgi:hypothetical protein